MAIIVEDGTIVPNANSYMSEADLTAYATARGVTITGTPAVLLIQAMDYMESLAFLGIKININQPLQWPRVRVVIDTYYVPAYTVPQLVKDALAEVCLAIDQGASPLADLPRTQEEISVGNLRIKYAANSPMVTIVRKISNKLVKLVRSGTGGISLAVDRK